MRYIDESGPLTDGIFRKYSTYVKLRKERNKFLKSLQEMTYLDWSIDKKLVEAGGIGKTVYILLARGGGSNLSHRTIKRYFEEGRDVQFVTLKKHNFPKLSSEDVETIRESMREFELYSKLANPWWPPFYQQKMFKDYYPEEPYTFDPCWTVDPYGRLRLREVSLVRKEDQYE